MVNIEGTKRRDVVTRFFVDFRLRMNFEPDVLGKIAWQE